MKHLHKLGWVLAYGILIAWAVVTLLPLYWMVTGAFKSSHAITQMPPQWWPTQPVLDNFVTLFQKPFWRWMGNSVLVAGVVTVTNVVFSAMAGYAFAKLKFPGRDKLFWLMLAAIMIPGEVTLIPNYLLVTGTLGWKDTYLALVVPGAVSIGSIFLVKQFMSTLPGTLIDAARIDACSEFRIWYKVILPMAKPVLAVLAIFTFVGNYNSFFWPLLVANKPELRMIQVGLAGFRFENSTDYGAITAGATLAAIPIAIIFVAFQKHFLKGVTVGALKG